MSTGNDIEKIKRFDFTDDGNVKTFLGVSVEKSDSGHHLSQPHSIRRVLEVVGSTAEEDTGWSTRGTSVTNPLMIKKTQMRSQECCGGTADLRSAC